MWFRGRLTKPSQPTTRATMTMTPEEQAVATLRAALKSAEYDFLDLGAGTGGSLAQSVKLFGAKRGLGVELNPKTVAKAQAAGHDVIELDLGVLPLMRPCVDFCTIIHVLEHIPELSTVKAIIRKAMNMAREFVAIRQPYFDADGYLFRHGLKTYWADWHGHPNRMTSLEFHNILRPFLEAGYCDGFVIGTQGPILGVADSAIHPITAVQDQHGYDRSKHPPKSKTPRKFTEPVFAETQVFIAKTEASWERLEKMKMDVILFDSRKAGKA